ncbi:cholesterol oxidase [bacterium BMS3Abin05]|nr:cholesterol oxidase [bacterium BMS3Abin05]GBE26742.1 cholesterol oxidase [bacterium BMS3Bbin03]HDZ10787.1 GMC family oxidoreductase [Bacteroidota bacterium]
MYDYIIIGSGFGGSVSALRLAEKGYTVAVVEKGKRWKSEDFPKTNWAFRKFYWMPGLFMYGIQCMTLFKDVFVLHGDGVGGGSLVYANTLPIPADRVFEDPRWGKITKETLKPFYEMAYEMLGAATPPDEAMNPTDYKLKEIAEELGMGQTFEKHPLSIFFGEPDTEAEDPYFGGKGPRRRGCTYCGGCMVGCRHNAKNTLDKNYLYLAERLGVKIFPETEVFDVLPEDGYYKIRAKKSTGFFHPKKEFRTKGVIFSGGVLGTVPLLLKLKDRGSLPNLPDSLGDFVRTNSEALGGALTHDPDLDCSKGVAITSGVDVDENTHVEVVRYGAGQDAQGMLKTVLTKGGKGIPRQIWWLVTIIRHPIHFLRSVWPFGFAKKAAILLVMQPTDNYMHLSYKRRWLLLGRKGFTTEWQTGAKVPKYMPVANKVFEMMAEKLKGEPMSMLPEVLFNVATTAHILGGCSMADSPQKGVINFNGKVFNTKNMYVIDGSMLPTNLGVNPSLTITALAEYMMSKFPEKEN